MKYIFYIGLKRIIFYFYLTTLVITAFIEHEGGEWCYSNRKGCILKFWWSQYRLVFFQFIFVKLNVYSLCRMQPSVWEAPVDKICWTEKSSEWGRLQPLETTLDSQRLGIEESIIFVIDSQPYTLAAFIVKLAN